MSGLHQESLELLETIGREHPAALQALLEFRWLDDGITPNERLLLCHVAIQVNSGNALTMARTTSPTDALPACFGFAWERYDSNERGYALETLQGLQADFPHLAEVVLSFPWLADDLTRVEAHSLSHLYGIALNDASVAERLLGFPWVHDDMTRIEEPALSSLSVITYYDPSLAERIINFPWFADDLTPVEAGALLPFEDFARTMEIEEYDASLLERVVSLPWVTDEDLTFPELEVFRLAFSFVYLERELGNSALDFRIFQGPITPDSFSEVVWFGTFAKYGRLEHLLSQPWFQDGLTEKERIFLGVFGSGFMQRVDEEEFLGWFSLDNIEAREITLPLKGDIRLYLIAQEFRDEREREKIFRVMEASTRALEDFIGVPYPYPDVRLHLDPGHKNVDSFGGSHGIHLGSGHIKMRFFSSRTFGHESGHHYFLRDIGDPWVYEGLAEFLQVYLWAVFPRGIPDPEVDLSPIIEAGDFFEGYPHESGLERIREGGNIHERLIDREIRSAGIESWVYGVGRTFWLQMYLSFGHEAVSTYMRELYLAAREQNLQAESSVPWGLSEYDVYRVLLSNTPPDKQDEFRDWYARLHGRVYTATDPGDRAALDVIYKDATPRSSTQVKVDWPASDAPIGQWPGVVTDGSGRVVGLNLGGIARSNLRLEGQLPPEIGDLTSLRYLTLNRNRFTGPIPAELGRLSNLEKLDLESSGLTGEIPAELGRLPNLRAVFLRGNKLTGCIPGEWRDMEYNDFGRVGLPFC